jgi:undecaprenyl-diphosphatase
LDELDHGLLRAAYGGMHGPWAPLMVVLTVLGGGWGTILILPFAAWARTRPWAWALAVAVATQAALVFWLKRFFGRVRPWIALGLLPPLGAPSDYSFPSGHAAGAFCVAVFAAVALRAHGRERSSSGTRSPTRAFRARALSILGLSLAGLVALSRVYLGAHFPGDVVAGAALGSAVGGAFGGLYARRARATR